MTARDKLLSQSNRVSNLSCLDWERDGDSNFGGLKARRLVLLLHPPERCVNINQNKLRNKLMEREPNEFLKKNGKRLKRRLHYACATTRVYEHWARVERTPTSSMRVFRSSKKSKALVLVPPKNSSQARTSKPSPEEEAAADGFSMSAFDIKSPSSSKPSKATKVKKTPPKETSNDLNRPGRGQKC